MHKCMRTSRATPAFPTPLPAGVATTTDCVTIPSCPFASAAIVQALSSRLGFTYNMSVANSSVSPDEVIASVADGTYDIVASWITINADRMDFVSFSYPFYDTGLSFAYRVEVVDTVRWILVGA